MRSRWEGEAPSEPRSMHTEAASKELGFGGKPLVRGEHGLRQFCQGRVLDGCDVTRFSARR